MERFAKVTRFCIICNYVSRYPYVPAAHEGVSTSSHEFAVSGLNSPTYRIIDPIASRCAKFRYKPLDTPSMVKRLQFIAANERIKASNEVRLCRGFNAIHRVCFAFLTYTSLVADTRGVS